MFVRILIAAVMLLPIYKASAEALSDEQLIAAWWQAQNRCYERPDGGECTNRDGLTAKLEARGFKWHNHDIWTSKADADHFYGIFESTEEWSKDKSSFARATASHTVRKSLKKYLPDEKIIALWNSNSDALRRGYPNAWPILKSVIVQISKDHSKDNNPSFAVEE